MTSEVLIMNRQSVALAADSAVTTRSSSSQLVTMEAEKLFQIGETIALMVYNRGDLVGRSWGQIAEAFVAREGLKDYPTVGAAAEAFLDFVTHNPDLFPASEVEMEFQSMCAYMFHIILEHARYTMADGNTEMRDIGEAIDTALDVYLRHLSTLNDGSPRGVIASFAELDEEGFADAYGRFVETAIEGMFKGHDLSPLTLLKLKRYIYLCVTRSTFIEPFAGMVFAGFGANDTFPTSAVHYSSFLLPGGKFKRLAGGETTISAMNGPRGIVQTFAQADMTHTFIRGIHPDLFDQVADLAYIAAEEAASRALTEAGVDDNTRARVMERMHDQHLPQIADEYERYIAMISQSQFVDPVLNVVEAAGKKQLAEMAKVMVELNVIKTELHQKQTGVGGHIDTAMITRKHGFEWFANKNES